MESEPTPQQLAELSALADGSLPAERRPAVRSMIAASPELSGRFEREQWVVDALRELGERERAPLRLRQQLEAARPTPRARRTRRISYGFAVAGGLAVLPAPRASPRPPSWGLGRRPRARRGPPPQTRTASIRRSAGWRSRTGHRRAGRRLASALIDSAVTVRSPSSTGGGASISPTRSSRPRRCSDRRRRSGFSADCDCNASSWVVARSSPGVAARRRACCRATPWPRASWSSSPAPTDASLTLRTLARLARTAQRTGDPLARTV
jgi:hypothetical protein